MKVELGHLTLGQWDIRHQMENKFELVDRKFDPVYRDIKDLGNQLDAKIDRLLYFIISGLVGLVGKIRYDHLDQKNDLERRKSVDQK